MGNIWGGAALFLFVCTLQQRDLSSPTRDWTHVPCFGSAESLTTGPPRKSRGADFDQTVSFSLDMRKMTSYHPTKWKGMCSEVRTSSKSNFSNKFLLLITERKEIEVTVMFEKMYKDIKREDILLSFRKSCSKDSVIWKLKAVQIILSHKEQNFNLKKIHNFK